MTTFRFTDAAQVGKPRKTRDGYLVAKVRAARTGVQDYLGKELGRPDLDHVRAYRPEESVFALDSMGSFKGKPITVGHPKERVTATNHRDLARGHIAGVARDGQTVALDVAITDGETVAALETGGPRELSVGYTSVLDWTPGVTPDGEPYDVVQRDIFVDHLALVERGRAGSDFRIGDDADTWGASPITPKSAPKKEVKMTDITLTTVVLGDEAAQVSVTDAAKVTAFKDATTKTINDQAAKIADLEKQIETKDGELKAAQKSLDDATSPAALASAVQERSAVLEAGKAAGIEEAAMVTMDNLAVRRAVVAKALGDQEATAMSDAAVEGAFAFAAKQVKTKSNDAALSGGIKHQDSAANAWGFVAPKGA